jgi:Protein of unknown function (DUF3037)
MPEPTARAFAYSIVRVVPRVERGESFNAGVVLFCRQLDFLAALVGLDIARLSALGPDTSPGALADRLDALVRIASGDPTAGPIAVLPPSERFGWLVAPSSTIVQPSPVHTGLTRDPAATLAELFADLVQ